MTEITEAALDAALKQSIARYDGYAKAKSPEGISLRARDCPLCQVVKPWDNGCKKCPVFKKTGKEECRGTPYYDVSAVLQIWRASPQKDLYANWFRKDSQREADFLRSCWTEKAKVAEKAERPQVDFSKPVMSNGEPVELLTTTGRGKYPVMGWRGNSDEIKNWTSDGLFTVDNSLPEYNLVNVPEPKPEPKIPEGDRKRAEEVEKSLLRAFLWDATEDGLSFWYDVACRLNRIAREGR